MTRHVTTPGGDTVEVVPDAAWTEATGSPRIGHMWSTRRPVLEALYLGGVVVDASGRATGVLHERAAARGYLGGPSAVTALFRGDVGHAVEVDVRGRRTFRIALARLPEAWLTKLERVRSKTPDPVVEEPVVEPVEAEPELGAEPVEEPPAEPGAVYLAPDLPPLTVYPEEPELEESPAGLQVAGVVAMELLTRVVEIISAGTYSGAESRLRGERDDARARLHERTEYAEKLRRQTRELGEELGAVRHERDGLRRRLNETETNLRKALSADTDAYVRERVQRELDRVMRTVPATRGSV